MLKLLEEANNFKDKLNQMDVNKILDGVLEKLNRVINKLTPSPKIQIKKDIKKIKYESARERFEEARESKARAIQTKDPELFRQAKKSRSCYQKKLCGRIKRN